MDAKPPPSSAAILAGIFGISTAVGWCGVTLLYLMGLRERFPLWSLPVLGALSACLLLFFATRFDNLGVTIRNSAPFRRLPVPLVMAFVVLVGGIVVFEIVAGVGWCEIQLLHAAGLRRPVSLWGASFVSPLAILLAFYGARYLVRLLEHVRDLWPARPAPPPEPPPLLTPEELARAQAWEAALGELRAAIARGVCPRCGAGGFQGSETFANRVYSRPHSGPGFVEGTVYHLSGRCAACGYVEELPFMR